nr:MAG TPA: hypothetical protein [Caudoviricetes sp.]
MKIESNCILFYINKTASKYIISNILFIFVICI